MNPDEFEDILLGYFSPEQLHQLGCKNDPRGAPYGIPVYVKREKPTHAPLPPVHHLHGRNFALPMEMPEIDPGEVSRLIGLEPEKPTRSRDEVLSGCAKIIRERRAMVAS